MKIALWIEDGLEQIVLTPETQTERDILKKMQDHDRSLHIYSGGFYECQGGWVRQKTTHDSTMIVMRQITPKDAAEV